MSDTSQPPPFPQHRAGLHELPVSELPRVGKERAVLLSKLGILTVQDLLFHRPRRYEDRRHFRPIAELELGAPALVRGRVVACGTNYFRQRAKSMVQVVLDDGTARLHLRWWNLPFMARLFAVGDEVVVYGKPRHLKPRTMDHPETEVVEPGEEDLVHLNRVTPIYPLTEGVTQKWLRGLIWRTLERHADKIPEPWPGLSDHVRTVEPAVFERFFLSSRADWVRRLHFPAEVEEAEEARRRLAFDEFLQLQRQFRARRLRLLSRAGPGPCAGDNRFMKPFLKSLAFRLTEAQTRVLREIRQDMGAERPMRRLLQGDVGSGKTVVAACCALMALESGFEVALMAPTEVLAEQHQRTFRQWFEPLGLPVELWTGSRKPAAGPVRAPGGAAKPGLHLGTHALLESGYQPEFLGLVIIDEQHKFGVAQREQLVRKGNAPHLLVMTATPIPRSLALTLYGDLDVSVIDARPPGRGDLKTWVRGAAQLAKVWDFVRGKLLEGCQAYIVYPRIDDAEGDTKAVLHEIETVSQALHPFKVAALHGRLAAERKEEILAQFRENRLQALLSTSLIEVGLDVPNATVMLVMNAERFGLAQLHQLRGRIGRGPETSHCILLALGKTAEARERLAVLECTHDGFEIAEEDMRLRGPGELLGRQQSGAAGLRFGDLLSDAELIHLARRVVAGLDMKVLEEGGRGE